MPWLIYRSVPKAHVSTISHYCRLFTLCTYCLLLRNCNRKGTVEMQRNVACAKLWCPIVTLIYSFSPPFYIIHYVYVCSFSAAVFVISHNLRAVLALGRFSPPWDILGSLASHKTLLTISKQHSNRCNIEISILKVASWSSRDLNISSAYLEQSKQVKKNRNYQCLKHSWNCSSVWSRETDQEVL